MHDPLLRKSRPLHCFSLRPFGKAGAEMFDSAFLASPDHRCWNRSLELLVAR